MRLLIRTSPDPYSDHITEWTDESLAFSEEGDVWIGREVNLHADGDLSFDTHPHPSLRFEVSLTADGDPRSVSVHVNTPRHRVALDVTQLYRELTAQNKDLLLSLASPFLSELLRLKGSE